MESPKIEFFFSTGFTGNTYYVIINGKRKSLGFNENEAKINIINFCFTEFNIFLKEHEIEFLWDKAGM